MSDGFKFLMLGLKGSGKTSYLAALWHLLEAREINAPLKAHHLQPDRDYLNRIRNDWLDFKDVGRSPLRMSETVALPLQEDDEGPTFEVVIPDLSGEAFRLQWELRKATRDYVEYAKECSGILLFVHPQRIIRADLIPPVDDANTKTDPTKLKPWSPTFTSTQVQLVELLQFITLLKQGNTALRIAVIVSAWDLVSSKVSPVEWIDVRLPLLSQFLKANADQSPFQIFGVSALGGDLERDIERLHSQATPTDRVVVAQAEVESSHDISVPLQFLLGRDRGSEKAR